MQRISISIICSICRLTSLIKIRYTYHVKIEYSDDGIGRDYTRVEPKGIAQETLRQKDRYPTKLRKAGFVSAPTRQFRNQAHHKDCERIFQVQIRGARLCSRVLFFIVPKAKPEIPRRLGKVSQRILKKASEEKNHDTFKRPQVHKLPRVAA